MKTVHSRVLNCCPHNYTSNNCKTVTSCSKPFLRGAGTPGGQRQKVVSRKEARERQMPPKGSSKYSKGKASRGWAFKRHKRRLFERTKREHLYDATVNNTSQPLPLDDELPGRGQFWCSVTGRHFESYDALMQHRRTKEYKRQYAPIPTTFHKIHFHPSSWPRICRGIASPSDWLCVECWWAMDAQEKEIVTGWQTARCIRR